MRMEIMEFGVDEIEIDDRCAAEQVLTRAPGREAIHYGQHEAGGVIDGDHETVTEAAQALISLNDLQGVQAGRETELKTHVAHMMVQRDHIHVLGWATGGRQGRQVLPHQV